MRATVAKFLYFVATFLIGTIASFSARADDWPATTKELMNKTQITLRFYYQNEPASYTFNLKEKKVDMYMPTFKTVFCRKSFITDVTELSEHEIEIITTPEKTTDGPSLCSGLFSKINIKERTFTNFRLKEDGITRYQSGFWRSDRISFD